MAQLLQPLNLRELVFAWRERVDDLLGDVDDPCQWENEDSDLLWNNDEATRFANAAQREFARRRPILDSTTAAVVAIDIVKGQHTYAYDGRILDIRRARLDYGELVVNGTFADSSGWTLGTGLSIAAGVASWDGSQVADSDLERSVVLVADTKYVVTFTLSNVTAGAIQPLLGTAAGTSRTADGTFTETITHAGAATLFLRADASFVGDVDDVSVKQEGPLDVEDLTKTTRAELDRTRFRWEGKTATLRPMEYIEDADEYSLRLVDTPDQTFTLRLTVGRMPLNDMLWCDRLDDFLEISNRHHLDLLDWMAHEAYQKRDSQTLNLPLASAYADQFTDKVGERRPAVIEKVLREERNLRRRVRASFF